MGSDISIHLSSFGLDIIVHLYCSNTQTGQCGGWVFLKTSSSSKPCPIYVGVSYMNSVFPFQCILSLILGQVVLQCSIKHIGVYFIYLSRYSHLKYSKTLQCWVCPNASLFLENPWDLFHPGQRQNMKEIMFRPFSCAKSNLPGFYFLFTAGVAVDP